jgi:hypothetical protein
MPAHTARPEAGAALAVLRRVERLEDLVAAVARDARAGVGHLDPHEELLGGELESGALATDREVSTATAPPSGIAWIALNSRLSSTCWIAVAVGRHHAAAPRRA